MAKSYGIANQKCYIQTLRNVEKCVSVTHDTKQAIAKLWIHKNLFCLIFVRLTNIKVRNKRVGEIQTAPGGFDPVRKRSSFIKAWKIRTLTFPKQQILDSSKLKEFADENGRKFSRQVENTVGKGEIARYEQFLLFPQRFQKTFPRVFSKDFCFRHVKTRACLGKG